MKNVPGGHQKHFGKMQQSKLDKIRRDSAEYVCLSLMAKIMTNSARIMAWKWKVQQVIVGSHSATTTMA
jgi:hypothetical protein